MYCPQCGHQQGSSETRFCSRCGLPFGLVTDLLANTTEQVQREKRELTGIGLMIATVLMLMNFLIVFGTVTLPHLANPVFLWLWAFFLLGSFATGGIGLAKLIRSGFFKRLKEREAVLKMMTSGKERQLSAAEQSGTNRYVAGMSVTETTTRKLEAQTRQDLQDGQD
jgi:hypothetical protein